MTTDHPQEPGPTVTIVFESLFGSTRQVAEAIADGIRETTPVSVMSVVDAPALTDCDVLVVGAPTHAHSLSRPASRTEAESWARDPAKHLRFEGDSRATGVREWIDRCPSPRIGYVAFDTRVDMPRIFTGSAASAIAKRLRKHDLREVVPSESFLVDKDSHLLPAEIDRARRWGRAIASAVAASARPETSMKR
ncbi:flavodoxin family protein [Microbacterium luteolum]|uniref:flavodoxin family protein n=1 Tax=Microbacterium luteolum TaxID=69367 RepID=UPI00249A9AB6|nr:flavodoxin domain-containing protein [Microbacterium luteolum]